MSTFRKIGLTAAVLTGLAAAGIVAAADEAGRQGCAGEHQAAGQGEHHGHRMERMSEMHKRMQGGGHRGHDGQQKPEGTQKQDKQPQGEEHKHS